MPLPADALVLQHPHTSPFPIHCCFLGDISSGSSSRVHHNSLPLPICSFHCSASCPKPQRQIQALGGMIVGKRETPDKHTELLQSPAGCGCCQCQGVTFALFYLIVTASNPPSAPGGDPNQRSQPLPGSCQPQPCPLTPLAAFFTLERLFGDEGKPDARTSGAFPLASVGSRRKFPK